MPHDYVPRPDANCLDWLQGLSSNLNANPSAYGVAPSEAAHLASRVEAFRLAKSVATNGLTRTSAAIVAKDNRRAEAVAHARILCQQIKVNLGVSDALKEAAGIPLPRRPGHAP